MAMASVIPPPPPPPAFGSFNAPTTVGGFAAAAPHAIGLAPDLRKRIEVTAEQIATSAGLDFENSVKQSKYENPLYSFLFNGEGAEYYAALVAAHSSAISSNTSTAETSDLSELLRRWREPPMLTLPADIERQASEVFGGLGSVASREAIRNGRLWIEAHTGLASGIAGVMLRRISQMPTSAHRIHLLFLLHDVLQLEASKQVSTRPLIAAFKPFLPWLLRASFTAAQSQGPNHEDSSKVLKLLQLWTERGIVTAREGEEMRSIVIARELPQHSRVGSPHPALPQRPPPPPAPAQAYGQQLQPRQQLQQASNMPPPTVAQQLENNLAILGAIRPAAPGLLPGLQQLAQTPETIPVGLMASMLRQVSQRGKDMHTAFMPYRPLDPLHTPQTLPTLGEPSERLLKRLQDFYDVIGDARIMPHKNSDARNEHRSRSRSPAIKHGESEDGGDSASGSATSMFAAVPPPPCD